MRSSFTRSAIARCAVFALAGNLAACGGGGASSTIAPARSSTVPSAANRFSLGLVAAKPAEIAQMTHIRHLLSVTTLPAAVDLSAKMPSVGDQGQEGSCVAWASAYAMRGYEARQDVWAAIAPKSTDPTLNFSASFIYNQLNGGQDAGISIPAALNLMEQKGAATLADMPYVAGQFTTQPSAAALSDATHFKLSSYGYIAPTDFTSMKGQLAAGIPVILAIQVYSNFFGLGQNQVYTGAAGTYEGGHAIAAVGYDDFEAGGRNHQLMGTVLGNRGLWLDQLYCVEPNRARSVFGDRRPRCTTSTRSQPHTDRDPGAVPNRNRQTVADAEHDANPIAVTDRDAETVADADTDAGSDRDAETVADTDTDAGSDRDAETVADADTDRDAQTVADTDAQAVTDTDAQTIADTDAQAVADTDAQAVADTDAQAVAHRDTETVTHRDTEVIADRDPQVVADRDAQTSADGNAQTNGAAQTLTDAQTFGETDRRSVEYSTPLTVSGGGIRPVILPCDNGPHE